MGRSDCGNEYDHYLMSDITYSGVIAVPKNRIPVYVVMAASGDSNYPDIFKLKQA